MENKRIVIEVREEPKEKQPNATWTTAGMVAGGVLGLMSGGIGPAIGGALMGMLCGAPLDIANNSPNEKKVQ